VVHSCGKACYGVTVVVIHLGHDWKEYHFLKSVEMYMVVKWQCQRSFLPLELVVSW
jgi:hypothetical protein